MTTEAAYSFERIERESDFIFRLKDSLSQVDENALNGDEKFLTFDYSGAGAVEGYAALSLDDAASLAAEGKKAILCIEKFDFSIIDKLPLLSGIVASTGLDHGKSIMQNNGIPWLSCVNICDKEDSRFTYGEKLTIDSRNGKLYRGHYKVVEAYSNEQLEKAEEFQHELLGYIKENDEYCENENLLQFKANLDSAANDHGYDIGLMRTEHLMLGNEQSKTALKNLLNGDAPDGAISHQLQSELDKVADRNSNRHVRIRLMDVQANELFDDASDLAAHRRIYGDVRGVQLAMLCPDIYQEQLDGIFAHISNYSAEHSGRCPQYEILVPTIENAEELLAVKSLVRKSAAKYGVKADKYAFGSMIETLGACTDIENIVKECDFINIGCNDLSAAVLGYDRNDRAGIAEIAKQNRMRDPTLRLYAEVSEKIADVGTRAKAVKDDVDICLCGDNFLSNCRELTIMHRFQSSWKIDAVSLAPSMDNMFALKLFYLYGVAEDAYYSKLGNVKPSRHNKPARIKQSQGMNLQ